MEHCQRSKNLIEQFADHWLASTADSNLTLHGFRRFKTTQLLNLRYLEAEIADLDHQIYQLGLGLNLEPTANDRLGIQHCQKDEFVPQIDEVISRKFIKRLRRLMKEYNEALIAFNSVMSMETFSLLDDEKLSSLRTDLTLYEKYKTRLVRIDQGTRARQDPLQRIIHHILRLIRYKRISKAEKNDLEAASPTQERQNWSSQNSTLISDIIGRVVIAGVTGIFFTVPLSILAYESRKKVQLSVVSLCVILFACFVSVMLRASNLEMMVVSAAYGAILSVFLSNL